MKGKNVLIFVSGAVIGSGITFLSSKRYFEKKFDEEVDSVRESFSNITKTLNEKYQEAMKKSEENKNKPDISTLYHEISEKNKTAPVPEVADEEPEKNDISDEPYMISASDFINRKSGFAQVDMYYFSDGVIADSILDEISNPADYFGGSYHELFDYSFEDALYFTSPKMEVDIAVCRDHRTFAEAQDEPY